MVDDAVGIQPLGQPISGSVRVPGSKSYTNRALIAAALAEGRSQLVGALFSDDTRYMAAALGALGIQVVPRPGDASFDVVGCAGRVPAAKGEVFVGNAGTAARFLAVVLALGAGRYRLDGVPRMRQRPMAPLLAALEQLGAKVEELGEPRCLPVRISGGALRAGASLKLPGNASSQFISGLLLSAPYLQGLTIEVDGPLVSQPYLDMTGEVMRAFGVPLLNEGYRRFRVEPGPGYRGTQYHVEPDASAASYFFAAAALLSGRVTVEGLGKRSRQGDLEFVRILERMGATVEQTDTQTTVIGPSQLHGVEVNMEHLSDTAQTLAAIAPFAVSPTRITGIGFIRNKETDRVGNVVRELQRLGVDAVEESDGMLIRPSLPQGARVETYQDHRMAMSFALMGLKVAGVSIADPGCTAKTFPHYFEVLGQLAQG